MCTRADCGVGVAVPISSSPCAPELTAALVLPCLFHCALGNICFYLNCVLLRAMSNSFMKG